MNLSFNWLTIVWCFILICYTARVNSCGNYNPTSHVCCDGNLIASAGISPSCCGSRMHDSAFRYLNIYQVTDDFQADWSLYLLLKDLCLTNLDKERVSLNKGVNLMIGFLINLHDNFSICCDGSVYPKSGNHLKNFSKIFIFSLEF